MNERMGTVEAMGTEASVYSSMRQRRPIEPGVRYRAIVVRL